MIGEFRAAVAGMLAEPLAQAGDLSLVGGFGAPAAARGGRAGGGLAASLLRTVAARSRRCLAERALNEFGIRIRSIAVTGTGKSAALSRFTCRFAVSTSGSGRFSVAARPGTPGSRTTAMPARLPLGTRMMSPRRNCSSDRSASARRAADRCLAASPSRPDSSRRSSSYSAKSPTIAGDREVVKCLPAPPGLADDAGDPAVGLELGE